MQSFFVVVSRGIFALAEVPVYSAFVPEYRLRSGYEEASSKRLYDKELDAESRGGVTRERGGDNREIGGQIGKLGG